MIKQAIHVLAALMLLASCSNDTTEQTQRKGISLRMAVDINTRVLSTDFNGLKQHGFYVSAFADDKNQELYDFRNQLFMPDDATDNAWRSDPVRFWPEDGSNLQFVALSPNPDKWGGSLEETSRAHLTLNGFSPDMHIARQHDILAGYATGNKNCNAGVGIELRHALTQVEIRAKSSNEAYRFFVKAVRIGSVRSEGDYSLPSADGNGVWTLKQGKYATYSSSPMNTPVCLDSSPTSLMGDDGSAMLLPQHLLPWDVANDNNNKANGSYIALLLRITTAGTGTQVFPRKEGEYAWAAVPIGGPKEKRKNIWSSGDKFVYTLDLTNGAGVIPPSVDPNPEPDSPEPGEPVLGQPIRFTVTVNSWRVVEQGVEM